MSRKPKKHTDLIVNMIYFTVQFIITVGCGFIVWSCYISINRIDNKELKSLSHPNVKITYQIIILLTVFSTFALMVDSLLRVRRFSAGTLVISKKLMCIHFSAFGIFSLSILLGVIAINSRKFDHSFDR